MENKDLTALLEQYKTYNYSKEQFINRAFATNRFYTVLCIILLSLAYILIMFTPTSLPLLFVGILGMFISVLWWLNVDSYNIFIKIKYKKIIDIMEQSMPAKPFSDEYLAFKEVREGKYSFVFSDVQKFFASLLFLGFLIIALMQILSYLRTFAPNSF